MTGDTTQPTINQGQILWRCRRGMLELDWLLQGYARHHYPRLDSVDQARFVALLEYPDATLLDILMGRQTPSDPAMARLAEAIRAAAYTA
ncbi:MAG: succinate dehydrogenase assembly factor 2 [Thiotrichales bacterium]